MKKKKTTHRTSNKPSHQSKPRAARRAAKLATRAASKCAPATPPRREVFPAIEPFRHGYLRVSEVHEIYYEECGNPAGKPAVFLHGGPGAGSDKRARQFFDPQHYR